MSGRNIYLNLSDVDTNCITEIYFTKLKILGSKGIPL